MVRPSIVYYKASNCMSEASKCTNMEEAFQITTDKQRDDTDIANCEFKNATIGYPLPPESIYTTIFVYT